MTAGYGIVLNLATDSPPGADAEASGLPLEQADPLVAVAGGGTIVDRVQKGV